MSVAALGTSIVADESLPHVSPVQSGLYEQAVAAAGVDPHDVPTRGGRCERSAWPLRNCANG
jgi:hypothetical protein